MKRAFLVLAVLALLAGCKEKPAAKQEQTADAPNTFTDSRDGKKYKTVQIGEQVWMAQNLNYEAEGSVCYGEGGVVVTGYGGAEGAEDITTTLPPSEAQANCEKYGRLYNWETAMNACPDGWRLPSDNEWYTLVDFAGGDNVAGAKLKAKSGWNENGNGTDEFGFSALPGGQGGYYSNGDGRFFSVGEFGYWWSATASSDDHARYRVMGYGDEGVDGYGTDMSVFMSVRCIKNTDEQNAAEAEGVISFERLVRKGDVHYLNNAPYTGTARLAEDCCTEEWEMKDGRFHGKYKGDFPNSSATGAYKNGKKHGEWKESSDGADSYGGYKVGIYKDDKKHGEWKYFNFEDEFKGTETWENDVLVKEWTSEQTKQRKVEDIDIAKIFGKEKEFPRGMLGANAQRMGIVFLSTKSIDKNKYEITGKSKLKNNICDFTGTIEAQSVIDKVVDLGERGGYSDGMITGKYLFEEDKNQTGTGVFEGTFEIYLNGVDIAEFDEKSDILFDGTWKSNRAEASKPLKACWSSGYEECAPADFYGWTDGQSIYVKKKYLSAGWEYAYDWKFAYIYGPNEEGIDEPMFDFNEEEHRKKAEKYQKEWTDWWKK